MTPKVLNKFPNCVGKPFRPSNGTEGMIFMDAFCEQCIHEKYSHTQNDADKKCDLMSAAMIFDIGDDDYPKEWVHDMEGWPICTAWKKWDWGNDGDPDDPDNPNYRPPSNPNQLNLFPLYPDERNFQETKKQLCNT